MNKSNYLVLHSNGNYNSDKRNEEKKERKIETGHLPKVLKDLDAINKKKIIKLRARKLNSKIYSLYLHAQFDKKQEQETLDFYILGKKNTEKDDNETLELAISIRDKKELKLRQDRNDFRLKNQEIEYNFINYYIKIVKDKKDTNQKMIAKLRCLMRKLYPSNLMLLDLCYRLNKAGREA